MGDANVPCAGSHFGCFTTGCDVTGSGGVGGGGKL